jgi:hypothetical protein
MVVGTPGRITQHLNPGGITQSLGVMNLARSDRDVVSNLVPEWAIDWPNDSVAHHRLNVMRDAVKPTPSHFHPIRRTLVITWPQRAKEKATRWAK